MKKFFSRLFKWVGTAISTILGVIVTVAGLAVGVVTLVLLGVMLFLLGLAGLFFLGDFRAGPKMVQSAVKK